MIGSPGPLYSPLPAAACIIASSAGVMLGAIVSHYMIVKRLRLATRYLKMSKLCTRLLASVALSTFALYIFKDLTVIVN